MKAGNILVGQDGSVQLAGRCNQSVCTTIRMFIVHVQSVCDVCVLSLTARQLQRASLKGLAARGNVTVHVQYSLHYVYSVTVDMAHAISMHMAL